MTHELPPSLKSYIDAVNQHDVDAMLLAFSKAATVKDEGKTYTGHADIRAWKEETTRKYRATVEVSNVAGTGDTFKIAMLVSGNFPGSPATLYYVFTLDGDLIVGLEVS
jgi:SnoaL-like protein